MRDDVARWAELVEDVRVRVRQLIEARGLRSAARDVGLSPSGLKKFARGRGLPYRPTWRKLVAWCLQAVPPAPPASEEIAAAIGALTRDFPADVGRHVAAELWRIVAAARQPPRLTAAALSIEPPYRAPRQRRSRSQLAPSQAPPALLPGRHAARFRRGVLLKARVGTA